MASHSPSELRTTCCIAGGGPAGMMLGFLLARAGIDVLVLEKHADFFRDFRGDTIHPSTFQLMHELGILQAFLRLPHQEVSQLGALFNDRFLMIADFSRLPVAKPALGFMPQWDFLNFLQQQATSYAGFHLLMETKAVDLIKENNRVIGVKASSPEGEKEIYTSLVVAADGRDSVLRGKAGLNVKNFGAPIDVLWFKLPKLPTDPTQTFGYFQKGKLMVLLDRNTYWQCGYVIAKGAFDAIQAKGLPSFGETLATMAPFLKDRVHELNDWKQVKLLTVRVDYLEKWYSDGFLCIGDAAHAMSPVAGVGINLAIQDAVAAANLLYPALKEKKPIDVSLLKRIQKRRAFPTRMTQRLQLGIQNGIIKPQLSNKTQKPPFVYAAVQQMALAATHTCTANRIRNKTGAY